MQAMTVARAAVALRHDLLQTRHGKMTETPAQLLRKELLAKRTRPDHKPGRKPKGKLRHPLRVSAYGGTLPYLAPQMSPEEVARNEAQIKLLEKACCPVDAPALLRWIEWMEAGISKLPDLIAKWDGRTL